MSLERLVNKINSEEMKDRTETLEQVRKEQELMKNREKEDIDQKILLLWKKAKEQKQLKMQRLETRLELEEKKRLLLVKQEIINNVYNQVKAQYVGMDKKSYQAWLVKRILILKLTKAQGTILIGKVDSFSIYPSFVAFVEEEIFKKYPKSSIEVMYDEEMDSGFVYKEGNIEIDCRIDTFISELKEQENINIAKMLF